jgi:tetratricopeptide (TPR) repeat protein
MNGLAVANWFAKKLDQSIPLFEEVLRLREAHQRPDHDDTVWTLANLGINYRDAGRFKDAMRVLEQAVQRGRKEAGQLPDRLAQLVLPTLADAYDRDGHFAKAEPLYRECLERTRKRLGNEHAQTSAEVALLALKLIGQKKDVEAEPLLRELSTWREKHKQQLDTTLQALVLGWGLLRQRKYAEAEPLLRETLARRVKHQPDNWTTFNTRSQLGGSLLGQKKYAEAEPLLVKGYEGMKARAKTIPAAAKDRLPEAAERLVELYDALGRPEEAERWQQELKAVKGK